MASASGGLIVAVAAADRDQANADATAEDGFGVAEANQTVSAWQAILAGWSLSVLNHVLEEELRHLMQKAGGQGQQFAKGTAQALEEEANAARKFPFPEE